MLTKSTWTYRSIYNTVRIEIENEALASVENFSQEDYKQSGLRYIPLKEDSHMTKNIANITVPDSQLAKDAQYGSIHADVCEHYLPGYKRPNFCDLVLQSPWNE